MKHHSIFWICSTLARIESDGIPVYNYHCWDAKNSPPLMTGLIGDIFLSHSRPCNECEHAISLPFGDGLNPTPKNGRHFGDGVCNIL